MNAMVVGYSFGGSTALALAGGELQLERLKQRCKKNLAILSLGEAMQCIAQLPEIPIIKGYENKTGDGSSILQLL